MVNGPNDGKLSEDLPLPYACPGGPCTLVGDIDTCQENDWRKAIEDMCIKLLGATWRARGFAEKVPFVLLISGG